MKQLGCLSPIGSLVALLAVVILSGAVWLDGGALFSPGPVTAAHPRDTPLENYLSHAEFDNECTRCHQPWQGVDSTRCLTCHIGVQDQIATRSGLHGLLQSPDVCTRCHTDHQGREADVSAAALLNFPHQQVGFTLARHRLQTDDQAFACADCHPGPDHAFDLAICEACHTDLDAGFVAQHVADFARDCLACHDGSGSMADFQHDSVFALDAAHATLPCKECHVNGIYRELSSDCVACHYEPGVHLGQFGTSCQACHTAQSWVPAQLLQHLFPLDHGSEIEAECQVCHPNNYVVYSCTTCHEHDRREIEKQHLEISISELEYCVECHPTGRETEGRAE